MVPAVACLRGEFDLSHAKPPSTAPDNDVLAWLPGVAQTIRSVEKDLLAKIEMLRLRGVGWDAIASALGLAEADAQALFSQEPESFRPNRRTFLVATRPVDVSADRYRRLAALLS